MEIIANDGHKTIICYIIECVVTLNMVPKPHNRSATNEKHNDAIVVVMMNPVYPKRNMLLKKRIFIVAVL